MNMRMGLPTRWHMNLAGRIRRLYDTIQKECDRQMAEKDKWAEKYEFEHPVEASVNNKTLDDAIDEMAKVIRDGVHD